MKSHHVSIVAVVIAIIALVVALAGPTLTGQITMGPSLDFPSSTPFSNATEFGEPEWQCFAQECARFITGQEWVTENCRLNTTGQFNCAVVINGQAVVVPLTAINVNTVQSCVETVCTLEVLTRAVGGVEQ